MIRVIKSFNRFLRLNEHVGDQYNIHYKVLQTATRKEGAERRRKRKCDNVIHPLQSCWTISR